MNTSQRREMNTSGQRENARLIAAELANVELLMETTRPVTLVVPQTDEEKEEDDGPRPTCKLEAYPPRYTENDPPYTCAKTLHQRATHAQRQYDRGGDDHKRTDIGAH